MSRIHEALKKAEQERAATRGDGIEHGIGESAHNSSTVLINPPGEASDTYPDSSRSANETALHSAMPSFGSAFNLDTLLARCTPIPWVPDEKTMLFFNGNDGKPGTEQFRTLRSRLYHVREKMPLKKVLVTSALPKEGKSFMASNLAQVMVQQHGRRALLIDGDLRSPKLHMMLGTTNSPGLADYLEGRCDEFSVMQRGPMENLFFIACGHEISNPAELVANGRLRLLLQRVEGLFDWIVIDSPPVVPVSDASVLAKDCDGVLLVVRSEATPADMARRARLEFPEEALVGVVLNGTNAEPITYTRYYYEQYQKNGSNT
jgi:protein-tyrosine kinase